MQAVEAPPAPEVQPTEPTPPPGSPPQTVVVYCDLSPATARPVFEIFTRRTKVRVQAIHADGAESLSARLRQEHRSSTPKADLWWSESPITTMALADEGVFAPYHSESADRHAGDAGWPAELRDAPPKDGDAAAARWYAFARQLRVIAYNPLRVQPDEVPASLNDLASPRWVGRIGIADPRCGPAAAQLAAIQLIDEGRMLRRWLTALGPEGLRVYPDEDAVAAAVAAGEVHVGLCGSTSAYRAAAAGPLRIRLLRDGHILPEPGAFSPRSTFTVEPGQFQTPLTAAIVAAAPNRENAELLLDYLLCNEASEALARPPNWAIGLHDQTLTEHARLWDGAADKPRPVRLEIRLSGLDVPKLAAARDAAAAAWKELVAPPPDR